MNVRVRGIYTTALTALLRDHDDLRPVQASGPIADRFETDIPLVPADAAVETTGDRQGVGVVGDRETVAAVTELLADTGIDTLVWGDPIPRDAVFDGRVTDTLRRGAVVDLGEGVAVDPPIPAASVGANSGEGFLPFDSTDERVEEGDRLRVQVREPSAPWESDRPLLDTDLELPDPMARLVRGGGTQRGTGPADIVDLISTDPLDGWAVRWGRLADDAAFDTLDDALAATNARAEALEAALADAPDPADAAPATIWQGSATLWCWFGRDSRFALDDTRGDVVPTMTGHHRIKAGSNSASAAVDFAEAICGSGAGDTDFPFGVVTRQFGPQNGDSVEIGHGKPDGRYISLGTGEVAEYDAAGTITLQRELTPGGTLDALGVDIEAGDVAVTKFKEGRWWYATVYRDANNERKGTYVNVCTPVEVFPDTVRYVDLHVDVVKHGDGRVERVDDDELDAAVDAGQISQTLAEKARGVAGAVENAL